jgi:hypothetical protein
MRLPTHVLYELGDLLTWRELLRLCRVAPFWRTIISQVVRRTHNLRLLRQLATRNHRLIAPSYCYATEGRVWLTRWEGPLYVWTPPTDVIITKDRRVLVPLHSRRSSWNQWLAGLMRTLGARKRSRYARGAAPRDARGATATALLGFHLRRDFLSACVVGIRTRRRIY